MLSPSDLEKHCQKTYNIVSITDLADLSLQHRSAFDFFRSQHRKTFEPSDRIILYTEHDPEQKFLDHIQRSASRIDISNWFIMIVCPFDLKEKLDRSNQKYGYDDISISSIQLPIVQTKRFAHKKIALFDTMCPLPFMKMDLSTPGYVKPCCKFIGNIGRAETAPIIDLFKNSVMDNVRDTMMSGSRPESCHVCYDNESKSTVSYRQLALLKYQDMLDNGLIDDPEIRVIDFSPSNKCNFACRICGPISSSKIAVEQWQHADDPLEKHKILTFLKKQNSPQMSRLLSDQLKSISTIKNLHVMGGEPFLWPELSDLIDYYIDQGSSSEITLEFNTNGSIFPKELLSKIKQNYQGMEILISLDNVGQKFEIERGGSWDEIYQNLQNFAKIRSPKIKVKLAVTVNIQNLLDLDNLIRINDSLSLDGIVWWYLENPDFLCIDRVTQTVKDLVKQKYANHPCEELQSISARVSSSSACDGHKFLDYMHLLDARRSQQFRHTHREIYEAMGGCNTNKNPVI